MKEELTNLRSDLKEKDHYLKNKLRIFEGRSKRNNIRVEGIPGSENEGWNVTVGKLQKIIKEELDIENVVIKQAHMVKRNNDDGDNNDRNRKPPTVSAKLLHFKDKTNILHEAKSRTIRNFYLKEGFSRETLVIGKDSGMKSSGCGKKRLSLLS